MFSNKKFFKRIATFPEVEPLSEPVINIPSCHDPNNGYYDNMLFPRPGTCNSIANDQIRSEAWDDVVPYPELRLEMQDILDWGTKKSLCYWDNTQQ